MTTEHSKPVESGERDLFEAWIAKDCGDLSKFGSGPNTHYRNSAVNNAWSGWKARAALLAADDKAGGEDWLQGACGKIEEALLDHRLSEWVCDDDPQSGFPLVDHLSHGKSIETGKREIEMLVETVYFALHDYTRPQPQAERPAEQCRREHRGPNEYICDCKPGECPGERPAEQTQESKEPGK